MILAEWSGWDLFAQHVGTVNKSAARVLGRNAPREAWQYIDEHRSEDGGAVIVAAAGDHPALALLALNADRSGGLGSVGVTVHDPLPRFGEVRFLGGQQDVTGIKSAQDLGILAVAFRAEPGAEAIHYLRGGTAGVAPVEPGHGVCSIVDFASPRPIDRYTGVDMGGRTVPPVRPSVPFTAAHAAASFHRFWSLPAGHPEQVEHAWIERAFDDLPAEDAVDLVFALLRVARAGSHLWGLAHLGAGPIENLGARFYERAERERDIPPENLLIALSVQRPEFMAPALALHHDALVRRLTLEAQHEPA